jgi:fucose permease
MFNRKLVFSAACLGMLVFGIILTTLGAILPSLIERFGIDKANAGSLLLLMSVGILLGSVLMGPIADRYGFKALLAGSCVAVLGGLEGIAFAPSFAWLTPAVLLVGLGGGIINGGTNALVADISEEGRSAGLSLLGIFFGLSAVGVPFMLGMLLDRFSYSALMGAVGLTLVVPIAFIAAVAFPPAKQAQGFPIRKAAALIRQPFLLLLGLMLFLESGMEITVGGWTSTFFKEDLGLQGQQALFFLSLFWFGMMLMRLAMGTFLKNVKPARLLVGCIVTAFVGSLLLLGARDRVPGGAGVFLLGGGLAAGFPVILSYVGDRYAALTGTAFSIVLVMALTGGSILPWATGAIGQGYGLRTSLVIVPVALVLQLALFAIVLRRLAAPAPERETASVSTP